MTPRLASRVAAILGFLAVALGAFGAHALKDRLAQLGTTHSWETAALYHLLHAVAMLTLAAWTPFRKGPFLSFLIGVLLFSGSLYALALTGAKALGMITPFGGAAFLAGWGCLAFGRRQRDPD
ncbi:MAG: DUF423 domain-containing protein [Verrucomicrobia bacterium]|nr:DUF423 domain-containing protein [Verrucomicrobiota bacterium]